MTIDLLIAWYTILFLGALGCLAFLHHLRTRKIESGVSRDGIFRCEQCGYVYTDDPSVERSRCPQCRRTNSVFEF